MKKENVIDLSAYQHLLEENKPTSISEELKDAIQKLIHRLREQGPLPQSN